MTKKASPKKRAKIKDLPKRKKKGVAAEDATYVKGGRPLVWKTPE